MMDKRLQHFIQVTDKQFKIADERYTIQNEKLEVLMQKMLNTDERYVIQNENLDERFKIADERYKIQNEKLEILMQKILNIDDKYEKKDLNRICLNNCLKDVWLCLTNHKYNPLSEEQADGFEKQLEERKRCLQQQENNIKNTIDSQLKEERKRLKDEYDTDTLKIRLENEYNKCFVDMKQTTYSFKYQLENQHNSHSADLERQYKSRITI
ncbi:hypothetical protein C1645_876567 [Glomus cerebriforme]|uniref:Uncharacterized protein n=1 Tax=Glomus cerebriforme TaxID=658196 RepID=A0A397T0U5_9GLOM|nr:hypothetical protein C1645_876567 [Glomus cerebriforme]